MNNFLQRLCVGGALGGFFCFVIYVSHNPFFQPLFVLVVASIIVSALWEYYKIAKVNGCQPVEVIGIITSVCFVYALYLTMGQDQPDLPTILLGFFFLTAFIFYFISGINPLVNLAITAFGVIYLAVPLSLMILIDIDYGRYWMLYLLLVTKFTDMGAYFAGKQWGKHKLAPVISPKKTWEGAAAGFFFGMLASFALDKFSLEYYNLPLFSSSLQSLFFGGLMSIAAQVGDLSESLLKRDSGVKDSNKLPGLGGILDMVDSLIFTTPLLYYFLKLFRI